MLVSILLPSIRPEQFRIRMREYANLELPGPCEVVVVTDVPERFDTSVQPQPMLTIKHLTQPRLGNVPATNLAFEHAEGHFVVATNDEVEFDVHSIGALVKAADELKNLDTIFSFTQTPYCSNDYYGVFFANCPFGRRSFFKYLNQGNYFFDPIYRCFYADPDLALKAHALGLDVVLVPEARCTHHCVPGADGHAANANAYYHNDRQTFITRWAHLGPPPTDPSLR